MPPEFPKAAIHLWYKFGRFVRMTGLHAQRSEGLVRAALPGFVNWPPFRPDTQA